MSGGERSIVYQLAVETGLRASELRSLTSGSFDLESDPPTVTVRAAHSKHRRDDVLPLKPSTAKTLTTWIKLAAREPNRKPVFMLPEKTARMIRADLRLARARWTRETHDGAKRRERRDSDFLTYVDREGRVADFQALRHTLITNLARGGVHPKQAQDLARHSDINLTMSRYSHTLLSDRAAALAALPEFGSETAGEG